MPSRYLSAWQAHSRRGFLSALGGAAMLRPMACAPQFATRGVVLIPEDLTLPDWPDRAKQSGLTTVALHHGRSVFEVIKSVTSGAGQEFLARSRRLRLEVEYELHAMSELLPRWMFEEDKSLFRMNEKGERVPDWNLCVHSTRALEVASENAVAVARLLRPTTSRYFYWGDDGRPGCRCGKCRELSDGEQALLLENHMARALRRHDSRAQLAHLAYSTTLAAPRQVKPEPNVFLEYAPIARRYDIPYSEQMEGRDGLANLDANLRVFPAATAQVLEYWLDVSRFSRWKRPAAKLPWNRDVFLADVRTYAARGIRHITSFACYIDAEYVRRHGEPWAISEYGAGLRQRM
ncbi:MAG TPA: DUF4838 domain-containing protein [Bryobacteraceae bacterium]|nr:DUF4838 domain-containing protein [Bryobacteraceae bacterium]